LLHRIRARHDRRNPRRSGRHGPLSSPSRPPRHARRNRGGRTSQRRRRSVRMNRSADVELVLREYFSDDSSSAPDSVLDVIEERIMRQPQQRSWRVSWRDSHVNSNLKPLLAVAAVVVVAVAGFAFLRPSGASVGGTPATERPTLSAATPSPTG